MMDPDPDLDSPSPTMSRNRLSANEMKVNAGNQIFADIEGRTAAMQVPSPGINAESVVDQGCGARTRRPELDPDLNRQLLGSAHSLSMANAIRPAVGFVGYSNPCSRAESATSGTSRPRAHSSVEDSTGREKPQMNSSCTPGGGESDVISSARPLPDEPAASIAVPVAQVPLQSRGSPAPQAGNASISEAFAVDQEQDILQEAVAAPAVSGRLDHQQEDILKEAVAASAVPERLDFQQQDILEEAVAPKRKGNERGDEARKEAMQRAVAENKATADQVRPPKEQQQSIGMMPLGENSTPSTMSGESVKDSDRLPEADQDVDLSVADPPPKSTRSETPRALRSHPRVEDEDELPMVGVGMGLSPSSASGAMGMSPSSPSAAMPASTSLKVGSVGHRATPSSALFSPRLGTPRADVFGPAPTPQFRTPLFYSGLVNSGGARSNQDLSGWVNVAWLDGSTYEGQFLHGKRDGHGSHVEAPRAEAVGRSARGKARAKAESKASGRRYVGSFSNGLRNGFGTMYFQEDKSAYYAGAWVDGLQAGHGTQVWESGNTYAGQFVNGKMHGNGTMKWFEEEWIEEWSGTWENGAPLENGQESTIRYPRRSSLEQLIDEPQVLEDRDHGFAVTEDAVKTEPANNRHDDSTGCSPDRRLCRKRQKDVCSETSMGSFFCGSSALCALDTEWSSSMVEATYVSTMTYPSTSRMEDPAMTMPTASSSMPQAYDITGDEDGWKLAETSSLTGSSLPSSRGPMLSARPRLSNLRPPFSAGDGGDGRCTDGAAKMDWRMHSRRIEGPSAVSGEAPSDVVSASYLQQRSASRLSGHDFPGGSRSRNENMNQKVNQLIASIPKLDLPPEGTQWQMATFQTPTTPPAHAGSLADAGEHRRFGNNPLAHLRQFSSCELKPAPSWSEFKPAPIGASRFGPSSNRSAGLAMSAKVFHTGSPGSARPPETRIQEE